jgi:hypothetical protein
MASFDECIDLEMAEAPTLSHPHLFFGSPSLHTTGNQSQWQLPPPRGVPIQTVSLDDTMSFAQLYQQIPFEPLALHIDDSLVPPLTRFAQNSMSFAQNELFQAQVNLPADNVPCQLQPSQFLIRKRAPKAPTISAKNWKPCENRIKELYVHDNKYMEEVREIINKEFGLTAT